MKAWKNAEKRIAELLGGSRLVRVGFQDSQPDVVADKSGFHFVVEVKHGKQIPKFIANALDQAKGYAKRGEIHIACFHPKNEQRSIVILEDTHFIEILESRLMEKKQRRLF